MQLKNQPYDDVLITLTDYVHTSSNDKVVLSNLAYETAYLALMDSLACLLLAQKQEQCLRLLGPIIPGTKVPLGSRVPGTAFELDPVQAAFDIGTCIRWLDYNDTWLAAEWGHPSDNLGGILAIADFISRRTKTEDKKPPLYVQDILTTMIQAYEIQGVLALENAFNRVGLDHVILVKVATTAVVSKLLNLSKQQTLDALSNAWVDGQSLRTYRHAPNTGSRKSWAAGDATSRAVQLVWRVMQGESGYPSAITAKRWGFSEVLFQGNPIKVARPLGSYVMENVLFKVSFPAEFHAQTAVEAAIHLHPLVKNKISDIERIEITTQEPAMRIINKEGPLYNFADRDHCLQYMTAVALYKGDLKIDYYSDAFAKDPVIDLLRGKMIVKEDRQFSQDYLDPSMRAISNAVQVFFKDNTTTERVQIDFPLGHKRRRQESLPYLKEKYCFAVEQHFKARDKTQVEKLCAFWDEPEKIMAMEVCDFISAWVGN